MTFKLQKAKSAIFKLNPADCVKKTSPNTITYLRWHTLRLWSQLAKVTRQRPLLCLNPTISTNYTSLSCTIWKKLSFFWVNFKNDSKSITRRLFLQSNFFFSLDDEILIHFDSYLVDYHGRIKATPAISYQFYILHYNQCQCQRDNKKRIKRLQVSDIRN